MAVTRIRGSTRGKMANQVRDDLDASGAARLRIYTAPMPASPEVAVGAQVLLGTLTMSSPSAPNANSSGVLTFSPIAEDPLADASGNAAWARLESGAGVGIMDCDVTVTGGGGAVELDAIAVVAGAPLRVSSAVLEVPLG